MNNLVLLALQEKIENARKLQRAWGKEEEEAALWIQKAIRKQADLEDQIMGWEYDYAKVKALL